jgi:hypothetical protein
MNDPSRRTNNMNNITAGWVIGGAILVLLVSLSIYTGPDTHTKSRDNPLNVVTQPQPQK